MFVWCVSVDVRWLIMSDVSSILKKVSRYCVLLIENDMCGGMKKKLNVVIDRNDCSMFGLCLSCMVENIMLSRYSIMRFVRLSCLDMMFVMMVIVV